MAGHERGRDAKTIAHIAKDHCGSLKAMFEAHRWPERGAQDDDVGAEEDRGRIWLDPEVRGQASREATAEPGEG
jgi:hypothetical protein